MNKKIITILFLFSSCFFINAEPRITNINEYIEKEKYICFQNIKLKNSIIKLYGKDDDLQYSGQYKSYYGDIIIIAMDLNGEKIKSYEIVQFNSTFTAYSKNETEIAFRTKSRSQIKGSKELVYYDSEYNIFKVFILSNIGSSFVITKLEIITQIENTDAYKYLIINKLTGEEYLVQELSKEQQKEYNESIKNQCFLVQIE